MRTEKTSARVATIAGAILDWEIPREAVLAYATLVADGARLWSVSVKDLKAVCASVLTQAPDVKKAAPQKRKTAKKSSKKR